MSLTLNTVWTLFNQLIQGQTNRDETRKMLAINKGQEYLLKRMHKLGKGPRELRSDPTNVSNTISLNYVSLPSDFVALEKAWRRNGSYFTLLGNGQIVDYDELLYRNGDLFFQTTNTGDFQLLAVKEPNIYFDTHFNNVFTTGETITGATSGATGTVSSVSGTTLTYASVSGTFQDAEVIEGSTSGTQATTSSVTSTTMTIAITGGTKELKISYWKKPTTLVNYDSLPIDNIVGTFQVGDIVTGGTAGATGTVYQVNASTLFLTGVSGTFADNESISGDLSNATADVNGSISVKPQVLDWTDNHDVLVAQAACVWWHKFKNNDQVADESIILDSLIEQEDQIERDSEYESWSLA